MTTRQPTTYHQCSKHVNNALSPDKLEFYRSYPHYIGRRFPQIDPSWFVDVTSGIHNNVTIFPWIEEYIRGNEPIIDPTFSTLWIVIWETTITSLKLQIETLTSGLQNADYDEMLNILMRMKESEELLYAGKTKSMIINIHNSIERESETGSKSFQINLLPDVEFIGDLIVLHRFPGEPIVVTYQMFVNCLDKLEAKFSWLFYIKYTSLQPAHSKYNLEELFSSHIRKCM